MTQTHSKKDLVLFVGNKAPLADIREYKLKNPDIRLGIIYSGEFSDEKKYREIFDVALKVRFSSPKSIITGLQPYADQIKAVTCRNEAAIPDFISLIPFISYQRTPTQESLLWSIDKIAMRRRFRAYNSKITPSYMVAKDSTRTTIEKIKSKVGYPMVIKPSGLAQSVLVSICYHEEELVKNLRKVLRKVNKLSRERNNGIKPGVLVEGFMDGDMYSIDGYVNSRGKIYFCPIADIQTGRSIGFDDFFGYTQITPTKLNKEHVQEARAVATEAIHALGLRSTTAHVELMRTEKGWKVIEVGPRVGGFRNTMYELSYGIDHTANDIDIRIPKKPTIPKKVLGHTVAMKFFAKNEGKITSLKGIKRAQELESFHLINVHKKIGDRAVYAKNGGKSVFNIILHNKDRSKLLADMRRLEQSVKIETK